MKKIFFFLCLSIFSFSCEEEDEIIRDIQEPVIPEYTITIDDNLGIGYPSDDFGVYVSLPISVEIENTNPDHVALKLYQNGQQVGDNWYNLVGGNGSWNLANNDLNLRPSMASDGIITAELYTRDPDTNQGSNNWEYVNKSINFTINWPEDTEPVEPEPEYETVRFTNNEMIELSDGAKAQRVFYTDNSDTDGSVTIELWKGGVYQGITMDRALIETQGFIDTEGFENLIEGESYQLRIINMDEQIPGYKFLDINDDVMSSQVFGFVAEAPVITVNAWQSNNVTAYSFNTTLQYNINTMEPQTLSVQLFESTNLDDPIQGQEHSQQTTGSGIETFEAMFSGSNPNTGYSVIYYVNGVQFFESTITTANSGSYRTEIENLTADVNNVTGTFEYDNSTGSNIFANVEFVGTAVNGNSLEYSEPVTFANGNINTDITISKSGFKQNSDVVVNIVVNGVIEQTQTITTIGISVTSYQMNVGSAMVQNPNHPNPSPAMMAGYVGMTTDGEAQVNSFSLTLVNASGLNPNSYISFVRINNGQNIAANWVEDDSTPGTWRMSITQIESILGNSINGYNIYFGTENYMVVDASGIDIFMMSMTITDDNGITHGQTANAVDVGFTTP